MKFVLAQPRCVIYVWRHGGIVKLVYLINPKASSEGYFGSDVYAHWGFPPTQSIADLAITTIAALVPDDLEVCLCDEHLTPVDFETPADFVGLTGKVSQAARLIALAQAFRQRRKVVIVGGPFASLDPEAVRPYCDILVRGEVEEIAPALFADLRSGRWKEEYVGGRPDLSLSPPPRWDLYPNNRALSGTVQTSRGCPFECEFCDVPAYLGRKQRHKSPTAVLHELDVLYQLGYRQVFLADDNFTASRQRAKELLSALGAWNRRQANGPIAFSTQLSIDAAGDEELLRLCAEAPFVAVFIGLETPNEDSLLETKKRQNLHRDLVHQVGRFLEHGIMVMSGLIVGFDSDGPDIFERQRRFVESAPVPVFTLGALVAPTGTPLFERLARSRRLVPNGAETPATPWETNIMPQQMTRDELVQGLRRLCNQIYHPDAFAERVIRMLDQLGPYQGPPSRGAPARSPERERLDRDTAGVIRKLADLGPTEEAMVARVIRYAIGRHPDRLGVVGACLRMYAQIRSMYELNKVWEPPHTFLATGRSFL